jgi:hypothetical protein
MFLGVAAYANEEGDKLAKAKTSKVPDCTVGQTVTMTDEVECVGGKKIPIVAVGEASASAPTCSEANSQAFTMAEGLAWGSYTQKYWEAILSCDEPQ